VKLARPDVFHPRIVFAGCPALPEGDGDDADLVSVLRKRGQHARWLSWDDPATLDADLVILRATWDYIDRLDEFLSWTRRVRNLVNAPEVVAWNTDKRYLADLARRRVPTVPSRFFGAGEPVDIPAGEVVVKPAIWAGSVGAQRFTDSIAARRYAKALQADGRTVLVQPYDARVEDGETALVFLGGRQSHAFTKAPILPADGRPVFDDSGTYAEESLTPAHPDFELWDVGQAALAAAAGILGIGVEDLLYARVDVIGGADDPRVLELELVEPSLGWRQLDDDTRARQQREFAVAVESALDRLGLGPFSHRRQQR
jgi:glutathione synthase/RimK-type ligase-like ATP-grasp enzyme